MLNPMQGNCSDERPGTAGGDSRYPNEAHNNQAAPLFLSTINQAERVGCLNLVLNTDDVNELVEYEVDTLWGDALLEMVIRAERHDVDFHYALADALWHAGCLSLACEDGNSARVPQDLRDRASDIESALVEKGHEVSPGEVSALAAALDRGEVLSLTARQRTVLALVRPYLS